MTHPSVIEKGDILKCKVVSVSPPMFGCHLCPRFMTKSERAIQRHFLNHEANAVHFEELLICRCNLPCRHAGHFHCSICGKTLMRKDNIESHLLICKKKWDLAQIAWDPTCVLPSPETPPEVLSLYLEHSYYFPPSVYAVKFDHTYITTKFPESPAVDTDLSRDEEASPEPEEAERPPSTPPAPQSEEPVAPEREAPVGELPPARVKCPHCSLVLYKRNLYVHIQRKHHRVQDAAAQSQPESVSVTNQSVSTQSDYPPVGGDGGFQCTCRARLGQSNV